MKKDIMSINEVGAINIDLLEVAEGVIEMRMPIECINDHMNGMLGLAFENYFERNPQINRNDVFYETRLVFHFGRLNPEFSMMLIIFDKDEKGEDEIWDELEVTIDEDTKKQIKKIVWNKLGEDVLCL